MRETADLLHHVPGRLRLRVSSGKNNPARLGTIRDSLAEIAGVIHVDINQLLGTVVLHYDPSRFADFCASLATYSEERGLFVFCHAEEDAVPSVSETDRAIDKAVSKLNSSVQQATGNIINLKELLPIAVGLYGLFFQNKAAASAQWLNWLQFAFDSYIDLHEEQPIARLAQKVKLMEARVLESQSVTADALSAELAALRAELRRLAERLPAKPTS